MRFGPVDTPQALGAVLAHSLSVGGRKLSKGRVLAAPDIAALRDAGVETLIVARLDPGDVGEDAAATALAQALVPGPDAAGLRLTAPHAGRVNLLATVPGIVEMDVASLQALNRIDPDLTLATLAPFTRVAAGTMVGTVKVIAYAVSGKTLHAACAVSAGAIRVRPVALRSAGLILTDAEGDAGAVQSKLAAKGRKAVAGRLAALGMDLAEVRRVPHTVAAIAAALDGLQGDLMLVLTGAATSDLHDVGPEALRRAGGSVTRFGMPVDPGNLLFLGRLLDRPVLGLPGCARSPALNGADWILERLACGLAVENDDIAAMGVGGLLKEIPIRPQPREGQGPREG